MATFSPDFKRRRPNLKTQEKTHIKESGSHPRLHVNKISLDGPPFHLGLDQTRLRVLVGRIPNFSRYLVTVRRAIFTPRAFNTFATF